MERARLQGKRIGRPKVLEREGFFQRFVAIVERMGPEGISGRQAAKELAIGYATFKRILDASFQSLDERTAISPVTATTATNDHGEVCTEVSPAILTLSLNTKP